EDRIRDDKDTGLRKFPFKEFALNEVWLEIVGLAHDLIVWTQALALDGELAKAEPKRLRYQLLHVAGRLPFAPRPRPPPFPPPPRQAAPPAQLALGSSTQGRVRAPQSAPGRPRLTEPAGHTHRPADPSGHRPRSPLPANRPQQPPARCKTAAGRSPPSLSTQTNPPGRQNVTPGHTCAPTARSGLMRPAGTNAASQAGSDPITLPARVRPEAGQLTTMPNGVAPAGSELGEDANSVISPPSTVKPLTASDLLSTTHSVAPSGLRRASNGESVPVLNGVLPSSCSVPSA